MLLNKYFASLKEAEAALKQDEVSNGESNNIAEFLVDDDVPTDDGLDTHLVLEMEQLKLEELKLKEEQLKCRHRMLLLKGASKGENAVLKSAPNRYILPDGRIVVQNNNDRSEHGDASSAAGDSRALTCSCEQHAWNKPLDSSTPSTCVLTYQDRTDKLKDSGTLNSDSISSLLDFKNTDCYIKCSEAEVIKSESKPDYAKTGEKTDVKIRNIIKCNLECDSADGRDETDRLTQLRTVDYMDIVDNDLKLVIALSDYPTAIIKLKHMQIFQKSLNDIKNMQSREGLLKSTPMFVDYYISKGAIVCICKNTDTRNWLVMIFPGLQERMMEKLVLLKAKMSSMYLGVLKMTESSKAASAEDTFKLLQYFNPTLRTHMWKIYSRRVISDLEYTYFYIDRVSREIIRGRDFKNVINFDQIDFELRGTIELYCDYYLSDVDEDPSSIASRVKLLKELKSNEITPRNKCNDDKYVNSETSSQKNLVIKETEKCYNIIDFQNVLTNTESKSTDDQTANENQVDAYSNSDRTDSEVKLIDASTSTVETSEVTESLAENNDNFEGQNRNLNIAGTKDIAYNRRTNYLQVNDELKTAIVLEGYPKNKLEGLAINRIKQLFNDCLHKDVKLQRFKDQTIPRFDDVYLSNGAVIYICDSLETKNYLHELLPRFVCLTGFNLMFRDVKNLVRYTRVIMKLPMQLASTVESRDILHALKVKYPTLNVDCWKYYSDVIGKRSREFGVDPDSLEVIKNPNLEFTYKDVVITFKIIDRRKKEDENEVESAKCENQIVKKHRDLLKLIYYPIDSNITNVPLARLRITHYSDLIEDDLKMYVGPVDYPLARVTENDYCEIKKTLEIIILDTLNESYDLVPKFYDIYLFDGVIFIICKNNQSKRFVEENIANINSKMQINLKCTEFRGVVGIISMVARTDRDTDEVIAILQEQNPRLRTKFWRKINTARHENKLEAVVQIDKLSALVIISKDFNGKIDGYDLEFKLGYLGTVLKPEMSLQKLIKAKNEKTVK